MNELLSCSRGRRRARACVAAGILACVLGGCDQPESAPASGPAERVGAKVDEAAAVAGEKLQDLKEKHGPKIEEAKEATAEGVRKLTGAVGEQLERAGQKAQEISRKGAADTGQETEQR